jgi:transposase
MPEFKDLPDDFCCPYRHGCPYLEGLPTKMVFERYQHAAGTHSQYEYQLEELNKELTQERRLRKEAQLRTQQVQAQLHALHRRQFKGRSLRAGPAPDCPSDQRKKRGAPVGHPPWQRAKPRRIDQIVTIAAPRSCPHCHNSQLTPLAALHQHVQEDIVLEPRTRITRFDHHQAHCARCAKNLWLPGPGEMPGAYIGPATKATATYLRYELNVSERKISQFFKTFFGMKFVPASAYGFERQAVRRGLPLYEDLREKIRALSVVHADETSWRNDGDNYWVWYAGDEQLAYFQLDPHRSAEAAQSVFGQRFAGTIVADAFASYKGVHPKDWQSCLSHIKTKAKQLDQELALLEGAAADPKARRFCQSVQGFVHDACQAHRQLRSKRWSAKRAKNKARLLRGQLRRLSGAPLRHPKAEAFRKRLLGPEQKHFFTCFRRPGVPPTNNQAERSLRPVVIMRKVVHGTRSAKGLENHSVLRSLFETARRQGKQPHQFFLQLFTKDTWQAQQALYRKPLDKKTRPHLRC